jgi:hypothetical protein
MLSVLKATTRIGSLNCPDIKSEMRYSRYSVFSGCGMIGSKMRESRCGS